METPETGDIEWIGVWITKILLPQVIERTGFSPEELIGLGGDPSRAIETAQADDGCER